MTLPVAGDAYSRTNEAQTRSQIDRELTNRLRRGEDIDLRTQRVIGTSPDGTRWFLGVDNAGATTWTAL